jgi:hypothetical protein
MSYRVGTVMRSYRGLNLEASIGDWFSALFTHAASKAAFSHPRLSQICHGHRRNVHHSGHMRVRGAIEKMFVDFRGVLLERSKQGLSLPSRRQNMEDRLSHLLLGHSTVR